MSSVFEKLLNRILFSNYNGLPVSGSYAVKEAEVILIDRKRNDPFEKAGAPREVPVHLYYPETEGTERFPLVIFSHGAFGFYKSNGSTYEELASNGYVVAALDHPHHAMFTKNSRGKRVIVSGAFMKSIREMRPDLKAERQYERYVEWMGIRTPDICFVIDELKAAVGKGEAGENWHVEKENAVAIPTVLRLIDAVSIGVMGHSMGGAAAVETGRVRSDVSAVIDLDGTMLGEYTGVENDTLTVREEPYTVPVLEFVNWEQYNELKKDLSEGLRYPNDVLIRSAAEGFTTTLRDTKHMDFTDLPLASPFLGKKLGTGERDTAEALTIVNSLVLGFFDTYLKGEGEFRVDEIY